MTTPIEHRPSLLQGDYVVVRIREREVWLRQRRLTRFGLHGSLVALPAADALHLVESGCAKLPAEISRHQLRQHVQGMAGQAQLGQQLEAMA